MGVVYHSEDLIVPPQADGWSQLKKEVSLGQPLYFIVFLNKHVSHKMVLPLSGDKFRWQKTHLTGVKPQLYFYCYNVVLVL